MEHPHPAPRPWPLASGLPSALAGPLDKTECIAPAKPGGGFDLTCKLAQSGLLDGKFISDPMRVTYMPGGIGAVAYNAIVAQRPDEANTWWPSRAARC
jgi:putative tricarboxylic transport membrane protein